MTALSWSRIADDYLLDNADTVPVEEIADYLERTIGAVKTRLAVLRGSTNPASIAAVREHWGKKRPKEIGAEYGLDESVVYRIARSAGLGPSGFSRGGSAGALVSVATASARPRAPRGYTADELAWALDHNGEHPEAGLILLMDRECRAWKRA